MSVTVGALRLAGQQDGKNDADATIRTDFLPNIRDGAQARLEEVIRERGEWISDLVSERCRRFREDGAGDVAIIAYQEAHQAAWSATFAALTQALDKEAARLARKARRSRFSGSRR